MTFLLDCTIKTSVISLLALLGVILSRKQSAAIRHRILSIAVFCAAILPGASVVMPSWSPRAAAIVVVPSPPVSPATSEEQSESVSVAATPPRPAIPEQLPQVIWLVGTGLGLAALAVGAVRLARLAFFSVPVTDDRWIQVAQAVSRQYGLHRRVRLLRSQSPTILVTWGVLRPAVLLPACSENWPDDRVRAVLCHELAHIRRGDWLVQITAEMLRVFYWFNPLLWIMCKRLRWEGEYACDDVVLAHGFTGSTYAAHLLEVCRALQQTDLAWPAALTMARTSTMEKRFKAILSPRLHRGPVTAALTCAIIIVGIGITIPIATLSSSSRPQTVAQTQTPGRIKGSVSRGGEKVPAAMVLVSTPDGRTQQTTETDAEGGFVFSGLPAGSYILQGCSTEAGPSGTANVELQGGQDAIQDLKMDLGFVKTPESPCTVQPITALQTMTYGVSSSRRIQPRRYTGKIMSVDLENRDIRDFLHSIASTSGLEIDLDPSVNRAITVHIKNVPWDHALDVVLSNSRLSSELRGRVLRITSIPLGAEESVRAGTITIEGKITEFNLQNPRTLLQVKAPDADGRMQTWPVEWASADYLNGNGVGHALHVGDQVIITGNLTLPDNRIHLITVKRPSTLQSPTFSWGDSGIESSGPPVGVMFVKSSSR